LLRNEACIAGTVAKEVVVLSSVVGLSWGLKL